MDESSMEYKIEYKPGDKICFIKVTGIIKRPEDSIKLQAICFDHGENTGCQKYLFDMRNTTLTGSIEGAYSAGASPGQKGINPGRYQTALVYALLEPEHRVMQMVLKDKGYNVQVFENIGLAIDWLNGK